MRLIPYSQVMVLICFSVFSNSIIAKETQFSFYGLLDLYGGVSKPAGNALNDYAIIINSNGMTTSFIGAKSQIALNKQLSAVGVVESFLRPDSGELGRFKGDDLFTRNAYIGLSHRLAEVSIGRITTPYFFSLMRFNPFGGAFGFSPSIRHSFLYGLQGDSSWGNSLQIKTASFDGLNASVIYASGESDEDRGVNRFGLSLFYERKAFTATLGMQRVNSATVSSAKSANDKQIAGVLGLSYNMVMTKLFAQYQRMNTESSNVINTRNMLQLGASLPIDNAKAHVSWARSTDNESAGSNQHDTFSMGYDYFFNKQIDLYTVAYLDRYEVKGTAVMAAIGGRFRF